MIANHEHLYDDDGSISIGSKLWFLDCVDGRIMLLDEQVEDFMFLLSERREGRFYESATEAFILENQRTQDWFALMLNEIADD